MWRADWTTAPITCPGRVATPPNTRRHPVTAVTGGQCPGSKHAGSHHTFGGAQGITVDRVKEATDPELVQLNPAQGDLIEAPTGTKWVKPSCSTETRPSDISTSLGTCHKGTCTQTASGERDGRSTKSLSLISTHTNILGKVNAEYLLCTNLSRY